MLIPWSEQAAPKYQDLPINTSKSAKSLVEELQSHPPSLRHLPEQDKPALIGGSKQTRKSTNDPLLHLHAMEEALNQLRDHCDQFMRVRERVVENDAFTVLCLGELKQWVRDRQKQEQEGCYWQSAEGDSYWRGGRPLLKSQLDRALQQRPGWLQLQDEVEKQVKLSPVEIEGFYVIRK